MIQAIIIICSILLGISYIIDIDRNKSEVSDENIYDFDDTID